MKEVFNAIALSTNHSMKINKVMNSNKNLVIASDWQLLVTGVNSPKSIDLSMKIHRLTGSKE